jgi:hypothetical protein
VEIGTGDVAANYDELPLWSAPFGHAVDAGKLDLPDDSVDVVVSNLG